MGSSILLHSVQAPSIDVQVSTIPSLNIIVTSELNSLAGVSWDAYVKADKYQIQYSPDPLFPNALLIDTNNTTYDLTGIFTAGTAGYVRVRAVEDDNFGLWSDTVLNIDPLEVMQPMNFALNNLNATEISFTWDVDQAADGGTLTYYNVLTPETVITALTDAHLQTSYNVTGLVAGETYDFTLTLTTTNLDYVTTAASSTQLTTLLTPRINKVTGIAVVNNTTIGVPDPETEWLINWEIPDNADAVDVYLDNNLSYSGIAVSQIVIGSLVNGTEYTLRFEASGVGYDDSIPVEVVRTKRSEADVNKIEDYGGSDFYVKYWGDLKITPIGNSQSEITYLGATDVFDSTYLGKCFTSGRITLNASAIPSGGHNYFPNEMSCVTSKVLTVDSGKQITVDLEYNGGNIESPQITDLTDGIFFYDNKAAFAAWNSDPARETTLELKKGSTYATLGFPNFTADKDIFIVDDSSGIDCFIKIMNDDTFADGNFASIYGSTNIVTVQNGLVNVTLCQFLPPIYTVPVVQSYVDTGRYFYDSGASSTATGLKKVISLNAFKERDEMIAALGSVRDGASFCSPDMGYCVHGGTNDGTDITAFNTYELQGDVIARDPMNFKGKASGGVIFKVTGTALRQSNLIEKISIKPTSFTEGITISFTDNRKHDVNGVSMYKLSNQDWDSGTSGNVKTYNQLKVFVNSVWYTIEYGNNGDWWNEGVDFSIFNSGLISGGEAACFDRIPTTSDIVNFGAFDQPEYSDINKINVWGWSMQIGTIIEIGGTNYTVTDTARFGSYDGAISASKAYHYTECTLDDNPVQTNLSGTIVSSPIQSLLTGSPVPAQEVINRDPVGHNMYTDQSVNMIWEYANFSGNNRATNSFDGSNDLYKMPRYAEFTECFAVNEDGTASYTNPSEYNPSGLKKRFDLGDADATVKISGGRIFWTRRQETLPYVQFTNKPHLIYGGAGNGEPRIIDPILGDGLGLIVGSGDGITEPDNETAASFVFLDGKTYDLSNTELRGNFNIWGDGAVTVNNITTNVVLSSPANYYKITAQIETGLSFSGTYNLDLSGAGGSIGFDLSNSNYTPIGNAMVNLSGWTLLPFLFSGLKFHTNADTEDANYCNNFQLNGSCLYNQ